MSVLPDRLETFAQRVAKIASELHGTEREAFEAGVASIREGPNADNCSVRHFATPGRTKAWERGREFGGKL